MNYSKHYNVLIKRARTRVLAGYFERHHVVPRCIGGSNRRSNIVRLTPEEHFVAHQLLVKMYPDKKGLLWATMIMTGGAEHQPRKNKLYGWLRRRVSKEMTGKPKLPSTRALLAAANTGKKFSPERCANISKGKTGKKHGPYSEAHRASISKSLMGKPLSEEHKAAISKSHSGRKQTPEHIERAAATRRGKKRSAETCAAIKRSWERRKIQQGMASLSSAPGG